MKTAVAQLIRLTLVGLATVMLCTSCASDPLPVADTTNLDLSDPDQVIADALTAMFTWNPADEESPDVAYRRAAVYLTGDLAGQADQMTTPGPGSQWDQWRSEGASIRAKVYFVADETPPDSDDVAHRVAVVIQSATTPDNRLIDEIRHTVWVTANKSANGWRITSIDF